MNAVRQIIIPRVRCPHCGSDRHRVYGKRDDLSTGDTRRYVRCLVCEAKYHVVESDGGMFNHVETRGLPAR